MIASQIEQLLTNKST